ncbi:MAG TPA: aldehyde ferredoxin oxidoreductase, partial [Proteobacteria bacterium]|nr:aldehyde ferredoxin oxidoreductase [Pseudomonadota bacterium]
IKRCGYDAIFFVGQSDEPVYFIHKDGKPELRSASELWGRDAVETEKLLKDEHGKVKVACIGQAGENLSLFSGIVNDYGRIAARSGLGAVMGSKKLKAVVLSGKEKIPVHDRDRIVALNKQFQRFLKRLEFVEKRPWLGRMLTIAGKISWRFKFFPRDESFAWKLILRRYGTSGATAMAAYSGDSPVRNWKGVGIIDFLGAEKLSDESIIRYQNKRYACFNCPIGCGGICSYKDDRYELAETHKPEYETLSAFGSLILNNDLGTIFKINDMCNRAGIDTISTGTVCAFAVEAFERGLITEKDTGGLKLAWGDGETIVELVKKIIEREDIGDLLADGVKRAAEKLNQNADEFAAHSGGQELPMHDPRYDPGFAVTYVAEPTPGRHTITSLAFAELQEIDKMFFGKKKMFTTHKERYTYTGKGEYLATASKYVHVGNGCGVCLFGMQMGTAYKMFDYINAATGWNLSPREYLKIGERIQHMRYAYNVREGITVKDVKIMPRAVGRPPLDRGPNARITIDMDTMLREFCDAYGWDYDTGLPRKEKLEELGLEEVKRDVYPQA